MQTRADFSNLPIIHVTARTTKMEDRIDHCQLSQWLKLVAEQRDKAAFTRLFQFFAPKIFAIARQKFPNSIQAQEVVQDTMTNVWRKAHLFDEAKGAATTWVYTVMRNVSFDMLRKIKGKKEVNLSDDIWPIAQSEQLVEDDFSDHLANKQLLASLASLPEAQQQVVKGFYLMEMSQEQLAAHLNLPLGTVKSRLRLALAKLKGQLGGSDD